MHAPDQPSLVLQLEGARVLLLSARYYAPIVDALIAGAEAAVAAAAGATTERMEVPGAFELPAAIAAVQNASEHGRIPPFDAYVALGCVIRGETTHYDYVCAETARGLMDLAIQRGLAIGFGVLTVESEAQALARAEAGGRNKGAEAAGAALAIAALKRRLAGHVR